MTDELKQCKKENEVLKKQVKELKGALKGVVRVADRATIEFDMAKQALSATKEENSYDKQFCLEVELHELVEMILKAKNLDKLQELTRLNFPEDKDDKKNI